MIPITKNLIQPIITSNVQFVESLEEFEKIELAINTGFLAFDNYKQCFYFRERDKYGEYSRTKIFFYDDFLQRAQNLKREEFAENCKKAGFKPDKIEIATLLFIDCWSAEEVSDWLWKTKGIRIEYDSMRIKKCRIRKELYPELEKGRNKQKVNTNDKK